MYNIPHECNAMRCNESDWVSKRSEDLLFGKRQNSNISISVTILIQPALIALQSRKNIAASQWIYKEMNNKTAAIGAHDSWHDIDFQYTLND